MKLNAVSPRISMKLNAVSLRISMKLLFISLLLLSSSFEISAENRCQELAINDCARDKDSILFEINTSVELCQQYCTITPGCNFYKYDRKSTQMISCSLYKEPFSVYAQHCSEVTGPKGFPLLEECQNAGNNPCDIIQEGNCAFWGKIEETDTFDTVDNCALLCEFVTCDYWVYQRETKKCLLQSNPEVGDSRKCNVVYGPPHADNCARTSPEPPTQTTTPIFPTTQHITAPPGLCNQFPNDGMLHTIEEATNCGCYWECFNGSPNYQCCTHCFLYDTNTTWCTNKDDLNFGGCGERPFDTDCHPDPGPPPCLYPDGYFLDNRTCDRYFICHYDIPHAMHCEVKEDDWNGRQQLLYNFEDVMCDWQDRVDCGERPICQTVEEVGDDIKYKHCRCKGAEMLPPEDFECPPGGLGIFGDPFNCQKFYFCANGNIVETDICEDPATYFDEYAAQCIAEGKCRGRPVCEDIVNSDMCFCTHE